MKKAQCDTNWPPVMEGARHHAPPRQMQASGVRPGPPRADPRSTVRVVADRSTDRARRARDPGQAGPLVTRGQCRSTTRALPHATEMAQPADED